MLQRQLSLLALGLAATTPAILAQTGGSIVDGGDTQVSAMMVRFRACFCYFQKRLAYLYP